MGKKSFTPLRESGKDKRIDILKSDVSEEGFGEEDTKLNGDHNYLNVVFMKIKKTFPTLRLHFKTATFVRTSPWEKTPK